MPFCLFELLKRILPNVELMLTNGGVELNICSMLLGIVALKGNSDTPPAIGCTIVGYALLLAGNVEVMLITFAPGRVDTDTTVLLIGIPEMVTPVVLAGT